MYCGKCGSSLTGNQPSCLACGHPAGKPFLKDTIDAAARMRFDRIICRLSQFWLLFAALSLVLGAAGYLAGPLDAAGYALPYEPWPHPPVWNWTFAPGVVWILLASRVVLALMAAWALERRCEWCRPVAIIAGAMAVTQFPAGLVLGAYTIAVLIGMRRARMYAHQGS